MSKKVYTGDFKFKMDVIDAMCECDVGYDMDDLAWATSDPGEYELTEAEKWVQQCKEEEGNKLNSQRSITIEKYIEEKKTEYEKTGKKMDKCALCTSDKCLNKYCNNY